MTSVRKACLVLVALLSSFIAGGDLFAAGSFGIPNMGGIFEGPAVVSPFGVYWNPAAIGPRKKTTLYGGLSPTFAYGQFERDGIDPNTGGSFDSASWSGFGPIPTLIGVTDFGLDRWTFAMGAYMPFGGDIDYGFEGLFGSQRYHVVFAQMASLFVTPTVSFQVLPNLYVGAGVSWVHTRFQTGLSVDLSAALSNVGVPPEAAGVGTEDPLTEAYVQTGSLSDDSVGWELGLWWQPRSDVDIGISYRSEVEVSLEGGADIDFPPFPSQVGGLLALGPVAPASSTSAELRTQFRWPQSLQGGMTYRFLPRWEGSALLQWTNWSRFGRFDTQIVSAPLDGSGLDFSHARGLNDTIRAAMGIRREVARHWDVGGQFGYESPAVPTDFVNAQNLDFHTIQLGIGARYRTEKWSAGLSYTHDFYLPRDVGNSVFDPYDSSRYGFNYPSSNGHYEAGLDKIDLFVSFHL